MHYSHIHQIKYYHVQRKIRFAEKNQACLMVDSLLLRKQILEKKLSNNVAELQKKQREIGELVAPETG